MLFEKSFYILRTNPKLTTNVKLVVSSLQKLYLESFLTSRELSEDRFRHYEIKENEYLFDKLPNFWEGVQANLAYGPRDQKDYDIIYDNFQQQFDDLYFSGAAATEDTWYSEEYEYLAPLYIKKGYLPKAFIVLRVDGPGLSDGNSPYNFRSEILNKWKLVSFFDMNTTSILGSFINKQINHPFYPNTISEINHENLRASTFNGIDYKKTGYVQKYVDFDPIKSINTRIFDLEETITNFWENFGIIYPHIINLKFLYDDTPATPTTLRNWSINRYVGFYIDEIDEIKNISPYKPFNLKKITNQLLEQLTLEEVTEIPYVLNNTIVRDIAGRKYTFDPIEGDWKDKQQYFIEWAGKYYRLDRQINTNVNIIGKYTYSIISDVNIKYSAPVEITNPTLIALYTKVLLNEISTLKEQIEVINNLVFENISAQNIIQNVNSTFTTLSRTYEQYLVNGQLVWGFRISLESEIDNNLFNIQHFNDADLHFMEINGKKHLIKQHDSNIPNIGGLFYLQTDYAVSVDSKSSQQWINNGKTTKDPLYYSFQDNETVEKDKNPNFYKIYRAAFTDIKDFDFNRLDTKYSKYEYEKNDVLSTTIEPKLYAKERRQIDVTVYAPQDITSSSFTNESFKSWLKSDPITWQQWFNQYTQLIKRAPVVPELAPVTVYFDKYDSYVDFKYTQIVSKTPYIVNNVTFTESLQTYKAKLPLYIYPTRIPVLDINNNPARDPLTGLPLWQKDFNGAFVYINDTNLKKSIIPLNREYYREEGYILIQSDVDPVKKIDFKTLTEPVEFKPTLLFVTDTNSPILEMPMPIKMTWSPYQNSIDDPNTQVDNSYIPVTSEYIASEEIWEVRNRIELSPLWFKNQWVCKWGFMNSLDMHDYAYRLNYDLEIGGLFNQSVNPYSKIDVPVRQFRDLDYFYRFGLTEELQRFDYYTMHLKETFFDIDKYVKNELDYFDWIFRSDVLTNQGITSFKKYSLFDFGDANEGAYTLFKGVKWRIYDVSRVIFDSKLLSEGKQFVQDYQRINSSTYNNYKFSIVMGRKLSIFENLAGDNDGDFGIDIIINDKYKNITIFIYFQADNNITFSETLANNDVIQVNLETAQIDRLYNADQILSESIDAVLWQNGQIKIAGTQNVADIRIRDLKLFNVLAIINEKNYSPINGSGRQPVRYIRVSEDGTIKVMTTINTDFIIDAELPDEFLIKEKSYRVNLTHPSNLDVNNSIKNNIILQDQENPVNPLINSAGAIVNGIFDIETWDGIATGRTFLENDPNDERKYYDLDSRRDPLIYRHSGPYAPIFNDLLLFRPVSYWSLTNSTTNSALNLSNKNWKFYDDFSDGSDNGPSVSSWGYLPEIIFSKINREGNILKLAKDGDDKTRSVYPMVDEYGYDVLPKYIFQSTWDRNYYLESRAVIMSKNKYPGLSGYTVLLDGVNDRLKINDNIKFNLIPNGYGPAPIITVSDNLDLIPAVQTEITLSSLNPLTTTKFHLINGTTNKKSVQYFFTPNGISAGSTNILVDNDFITAVVFIPDNITCTSIRIQSGNFLNYIPVFDEVTPSNFNGHLYLLNRESSGNNTVFASTQLSVQPINGEIQFTLETNTRGKIQYDYYIPSNVPREKFIREFNIPKFVTESNVFLMPDYQMINVTGDVTNLTFTIKANISGPTLNFNTVVKSNAVENTVFKISAPVDIDYVEKSAVSQLQFLGQNNNLTSFSNKCILSVTVEFWIKSEGFEKESETILYKGSEDLNNTNILNDWSWIIRRHKNTGKIEFLTQSYDVSDGQDLLTITKYNASAKTGTPVYTDVLVSATDIDDGQFHHVAFVFDNINRKKYIYIDQTLDAIVENRIFTNIIIDEDPNISDKNWPIIIGSDYQNGVLNFSGSIDELRIWNYPRSAGQIRSNYNLRVTPESYLDPYKNLLVYYRFDEREGTLEIDDFSNALFQLERVDIISKTITSNGVQVITSNVESFKQNEVTVFNKTPIIISGEDVDWVISGAELKGLADERYVASLPPSTTKTNVIIEDQIITPRSKYAGVFEPSVDPAPRPSLPIPTIEVKEAEVIVLPIVKPERVKRTFNFRHKIKPVHVFLRRKKEPVLKRIFNRIDIFNAHYQFIRERNEPDDVLNIFERDQILDREPDNFINQMTPISDNVQEKKVTISQNADSGVKEALNGLFFSPLTKLIRRR
jgi:hypothetical protein